MSDEIAIRIEIDLDAGAAYISLSEHEVARTVTHHSLINIDLDELNMVVGIEVLGEGVALPFEELATNYHVHSDVVAMLRSIRPDVMSYASMSTASDGRATATGRSPVPA